MGQEKSPLAIQWICFPRHQSSHSHLCPSLALGIMAHLPLIVRYGVGVFFTSFYSLMSTIEFYNDSDQTPVGRPQALPCMRCCSSASGTSSQAHTSTQRNYGSPQGLGQLQAQVTPHTPCPPCQP